jgi:hypothetical protein
VRLFVVLVLLATPALAEGSYVMRVSTSTGAKASIREDEHGWPFTKASCEANRKLVTDRIRYYSASAVVSTVCEKE